jgi:multiple antibiotic resistance protein
MRAPGIPTVVSSAGFRKVEDERMSSLQGYFHEDVFLKFLAALLALLNPLYGIPIFLSMTDGYTAAERRRTASIITVTVLVIATIATTIGEEILGLFGIEVPAFQIAGGLIILGIALAMLKDDTAVAGDSKAAAAGHQRKSNIAIVPLAIPLTIGPGGIATIILFAHLLDDTSEIVTMIPVVVGVCLTLWLGFLFADPIARFLGATAISVITRIMAIILAAVAVEMVINGVFDVIGNHYPDLTKALGADS